MTLYHGDCLAIMPTLPAQSVDAVICDIPSGRTACAWDVVIPFDAMWANLKRLIKPRGAIVLLGCTQPFTSMLVMSNPKWFRYEWVWDKVNRLSGHLNSNKRPLFVTESICVFGDASVYNPQKERGKPYIAKSKGRKSTNYGAQRDEVVTINNGWYHPRNLISIPADERGTEGRIHSTQKPVALMEYLIRTYTNEGDTVLDFAAGSGTTAVAAINTGRKFIAIEQDANYHAIAERRISDAQAALVQLELVA